MKIETLVIFVQLNIKKIGLRKY